MKRKIMLLMMIIPLVLIVTIMTVGKTVGVVTDVPAAGIRITTQNDDGIISVDMANYSDVYITAEVLPVSAKNREYGVSVSGVGGNDPADVEVLSDGKLKINGVGQAKITVTSNQNAFTDSVILSVTSTKVVDFSPSLSSVGGSGITLNSSNGDYDYVGTMSSGTYRFGFSVYPSNLTESLIEWSSSNPEVVTVDAATGKVKAMLSGDAVISAVCPDAVNGDLIKRIKLSVSKKETASGLTVNGVENGTLLCFKDSEKSVVYVETDGGAPTLGGDVSKLESYTVDSINGSSTRYKVTLFFDENKRDENINLSFTSGGEANNLTVSFADYEFDVYTGYHTDSSSAMYHKNGATVTYYTDGEPYDENVTYTWQSSNTGVLEVSGNGRSAAVTAKGAGNAELTVKAYLNNKQIGSAVVKTVKVVDVVYAVDFAENAKIYGIGDELSIGGYKLNGNTYQKDYSNIGVKYKTADGWKAFDGNADVLVTSSDGDVADVYRTVDKIKTSVNGDGDVTFTAAWKYSSYFGDSVTSSFTFRAVENGVNVGDYSTLVKATEDGKEIVLTSDVMLGRKGASASELEAMTKSMPTTYDYQYYTNQGLARPTVKYLVEFKNNVYGNGYEINGDYFTRATDAVGTPLVFKGPLDFVAVTNAAVKAQDNIVFLVRTDGVTLNNVVLNGCKNDSLIDPDNGNFDLSLLNNAGTVLEICSDADVLNCRISNGRTVVRIFGRGTDGNPVVKSASEVNAAEEKISVTLESCIMNNAREFILKIGSNRAIAALGNSSETFAPSKLYNNGAPYAVYNDANALDEYFVSNYVLTDVTATNCVFSTSGLFSVGMEAHFAGEMLSGYGLSVSNWHDLAATSFPSALHLNGKIGFLDWKKLDNVDSSTLIETTGNLSEVSRFLKLDIVSMLQKVSSSPDYTGIISDEDGETYVHGGIAMYGGGLNYSFVDFGSMTSEIPSSYRINLSVLAAGEADNTALYMQGTMLPKAAGTSDFRFYMYNNNSHTDYQRQLAAINSGEAYKIPAAKR